MAMENSALNVKARNFRGMAFNQLSIEDQEFIKECVEQDKE